MINNFWITKEITTGEKKTLKQKTNNILFACEKWCWRRMEKKVSEKRKIMKMY